MNMTYGLLPWPAYAIAILLYVPLLAFALYSAPWNRLRTNENFHVFFGSCLILILLWQMKAGLTPGLYYHLLGGTLFTLMFGWRFALIGISLVMAGVTANGQGDWVSFALNVLIMGALPIAFTQGLHRFALRYLPHHFFVYVLFNAYFGGGVAMAATVSATAILFACCGSLGAFRLSHEFLPFAPLMIFAEGFFSGMLATSMALMRPQWITTFDDRTYIAGK